MSRSVKPDYETPRNRENTRKLEPETTDKCTCTLVDEKYWFSHYGAIEPGSQWEWNPDCPVHQ